MLQVNLMCGNGSGSGSGSGSDAYLIQRVHSGTVVYQRCESCVTASVTVTAGGTSLALCSS